MLLFDMFIMNMFMFCLFYKLTKLAVLAVVTRSEC